MAEKENKLKMIRISLRKSKAAIAREAGIDVKTYDAIENGTRLGRDITRGSIKDVINKHRKERGEPLVSEEEIF